MVRNAGSNIQKQVGIPINRNENETWKSIYGNMNIAVFYSERLLSYLGNSAVSAAVFRLRSCKTKRFLPFLFAS